MADSSAQVQDAPTSDQNLRTPQNGARVTIQNNLTSQMTLIRTINWNGSQGNPTIPNTIRLGESGVFNHLGGANFGSKAAVIYAGSNASATQCAWVLAWDAPSDFLTPTSNKVYVFCDTRNRVNAMTDPEIRNNLDNSDANAEWESSTQKINAIASINYSPTGMADVQATFGLV